ncbi:MAG: hypothetical protein ACR2G3_00615 [Solirubrobacterales bacterium]
MPATKPKPEQLYVCIETFASAEHVARQGTRLRGGHPIVKKHPQFFASADASDDELHDLRMALNPPEPEPEPISGRVKLRVIPGQRVIQPKGNTISEGETFEAEGKDAQDLLHVGAVEVVGKARRRRKAA